MLHEVIDMIHNRQFDEVYKMCKDYDIKNNVREYLERDFTGMFNNSNIDILKWIKKEFDVVYKVVGYLEYYNEELLEYYCDNLDESDIYFQRDKLSNNNFVTSYLLQNNNNGYILLEYLYDTNKEKYNKYLNFIKELKLNNKIKENMEKNTYIRYEIYNML